MHLLLLSLWANCLTLPCFYFILTYFFVFPLHSFGRQLGGRRGCECLILEPSEMIVVSIDTVLCSPFILDVLSLFLSPRAPYFYPPTAPFSALWYSSSFSSLMFAFYFFLLPYILFLFFIVSSLSSITAMLLEYKNIGTFSQFPLEAV